MNKTPENYNLEERTLKFGEEMIIFVNKLPANKVNNELVGQMIRSATSIGANYCEANGASSKKDFRNKICICKKEAKETKYWIQLISVANPDQKDKCRKLWKEAQELTLIFSKIVLTLDERNKK